MNDADIIKALECCSNAEDILVKGKTYKAEPLCDVFKSALDLILRQKADYLRLEKSYIKNQEIFAEQCLENERLKVEIERLEKCLDLVQGAKCVYSYDGETLEYCVHSPCPICKTVDQIRAEAITEFAERLKRELKTDYINGTREHALSVITEIAKEMKGSPTEENDVKCKDCEYLMFSDCYGECRKAYKGIVNPNDSCGKGKKRVKGEQ